MVESLFVLFTVCSVSPCCCLFCRYLVEAPANVCTPRHLAAAAQHITALNPDRFRLKVVGHTRHQHPL